MQGPKAGKRLASFWNRRKANRGWGGETGVSLERRRADDTGSAGHGEDSGSRLSDTFLAAY